MAATTKTESLNLGNPQEVLADCLIKTQSVYFGLIDQGFSSDLYREAGRTMRCLAKCLAEASVTYDELDDDDAAEGLAEFEEEEQA